LNLCHQKAYVIFNKLFVNNIEDSSGIFIGTNQAIGWSTYSKSNQGFGNLRNATLTNSISVVQDPDVIDTPIEDVRYITLTEASNPLQQCAIEFNSIHANSLFNGSAIDLGDNKQLGWRSSRKVNYGFGKSLGSNRVNQVASIIFDDDAIDAPFHNEGTITENVKNVEKNIQIISEK
jgi:hypothetical protein